VLAVSDTWEDIHLFQVFDSNVNQANVRDIARRYDFVWGATVKNVNTYRATSDNITISKYIPFNRDPDVTHTISYWRQFHPDWVIYQCDRATPITLFGNPNLVLDISNPQVIQWQIDTIITPARDAGYHMLAVDSFGFGNFFGACGVWRGDQWVQLYSSPTDPQYRTDVVNWLTQITSTARGYSLGLAVLFSRGYNPGVVDTDLEVVFDAADAIVDGRGFTDFGNGFANSSVFAETLAYMQYVQRRGKAYYSLNQYPIIDVNVMNWVLGSYLLGKEHAAAVSVTVQGMYGSVKWYNEYGARIGSPTSEVQILDGGVYTRSYSNGMVVVNTGASSTRVALPSPGTSLSGRVWVDYVTVRPQTGEVLLYNLTFSASPFTDSNSGVSVSVPLWLLVVAILSTLYLM